MRTARGESRGVRVVYYGKVSETVQPVSLWPPRVSHRESPGIPAEFRYMLIPLGFVTIGGAGIYFTTVGSGSRVFQKRAGTIRTS